MCLLCLLVGLFYMRNYKYTISWIKYKVNHKFIMLLLDYAHYFFKFILSKISFT